MSQQKIYCPHCNGYGWEYKTTSSADQILFHKPNRIRVKCFLCDGKGWIYEFSTVEKILSYIINGKAYP